MEVWGGKVCAAGIPILWTAGAQATGRWVKEER